MEKAHPTRWAFFMGEEMPVSLRCQAGRSAGRQKGARGPLVLCILVLTLISGDRRATRTCRCP